MRTRQIRKLAASGLALIVLACLWFFFAPIGLGGSTSYVVTDGISMQPRFHTGDLAVVRSRGDYRVGEIVAYHNREFHTIVLHRIIALAGGRYVFKGDNNNFVDFEHPARSQLIGSLWIHVPGVGAKLESIRSPVLTGVLVGLGTLLLAGAAFTQKRRRRRRQRRGGESAVDTPRPALPHATEPVVGVLALGALILLPFLVLALLAFTRPSSALLPSKVPYKQSGTLSYSANSAPGPIYSGNRAVTGEPLFTHVIGLVDLRFGYLFHSAAAHSLTGKASLSATIASTSGWQTTLPLGRPTYFRGDHAVVNGTLDLTSLLALLGRVQSETATSGSYTLTIVPQVSTRGIVDALPLHGTFSPQIRFSLTKLEMQPALPTDATGTGERSSASPFAPTTSGVVSGKRRQPLFISFKFVQVQVATARAIALGGIALVVCAVLAMLALLRPRERDELAGIRARYGRMIVPVAHVSQLPGLGVIDVADIEALVRIAEHYDRSILHESIDGRDAFWVVDESGQFRYSLAGPGGAVEEVAAPQPPAPATDDVYVEELEPMGPISAFETRIHRANPGQAVGPAQATGPAQAAGSGHAPEPAYAADDPVHATTAVHTATPALAAEDYDANGNEATGQDDWAAQVFAGAVAQGSQDWRAACEASGVILNAPDRRRTWRLRGFRPNSR